MQIIQTTLSVFLQTHMKNILSVETLVLPTTMTRCAFYPVIDVTLYWRVLLKGYYRNWTQCAPHIKKLIDSRHYSNIDSVSELLPTVDDCLIMCKRPFISTNRKEEWTE